VSFIITRRLPLASSIDFVISEFFLLLKIKVLSAPRLREAMEEPEIRSRSSSE